MREIVLDTETTGLDPRSGHRVVEIGCIELINHMPTGDTYHQYINPERPMPIEAYEVHGLDDAFLSEFPIFADIAQAFLSFIDDAKLVIHNAGFDMRFLNSELSMIGQPALPMRRAIDTVQLARSRFPGAQASLDALCRRFEIDNSARTKHGALLDAELLADVYLELIGGRQPGLELSSGARRQEAVEQEDSKPVRPPRPHNPSAEELAAHQLLLQRLENPIWSG